MSEQAAVDIRTATAADQAGVVQVLSEAFADDPVFSWIYPDAATRHRVLPGFFRLIEAHSVRHGTNLVAGPDAGAAIWAPPGEVMVDPADEEAFGNALVALAPADAARLAICNQILGAHHPTDPHWYLSLIGVGDAHRGRGIGSALLRAATERCDAGAAPAYLEATSPDNRRLYERHGFAVTGEMVLPDGPSVWAMWREPGT